MPATTDFDDWYQTYPRHVGRRKAEASWRTAIKEIQKSRRCDRSDAIAWLLGVTMTFAASEKGDSGEFCPYPSTWLNQGRYDDDPAEWGRKRAVARVETDPEKARQWRP